MSLLTAIQRSVLEKIETKQHGVSTHFDVMLLSWIAQVSAVGDSVSSSEGMEKRVALMSRISDYSSFTSRPRFSPYLERAAESQRRKSLDWEPDILHINANQGVEECLRWRGLPLMKSAFDFAIVPLLITERRPATIIEIGSGSGASAAWMADILELENVPGHVYSIDRVKPDLVHQGVTFIEGDCRDMKSALPREVTASLPHPWIVFEDAHQDTLGVLSYFAQEMQTGDYFVVEDSRIKAADLASFAEGAGNRYAVDARYTDFFGWNATSCADSILVAP